jgi:hypothetical protein
MNNPTSSAAAAAAAWGGTVNAKHGAPRLTSTQSGSDFVTGVVPCNLQLSHGNVCV